MSEGTHVQTVELGSAEFWQRVHEDPARLAAEICKINVVRLDDALQTHPALRAWVGAQYELARIEEESAKFTVTKKRALVMLECKADVDPQTKKPKTVGVLEAEVENHPDVHAATQALLDVQRKKAALKAMADGMEDRLQMLIQISSNQRAEKKAYD